MLRFYPEKTKIIFFDLEFYVPEKDRTRKSPSGMKYNPTLPAHKILGGTFSTYYPLQNRMSQSNSFWEWGSGSEKNVLAAILELLQREWKSIEAKDQAGSLMLSGIGISHSDIPALLARLTSLSLDRVERIYDLLCGCRQIDLTTATFNQFASKHEYFAYPKSKSALYQKYLSGKKMDSGEAVWELYDRGEYGAIEARNVEEVADAIAIYKNMFDLKKQTENSLKKLKRIEKRNHDNRALPDDA